ncbi:alternative ribosome rescue aminoacyl-tRNA hydrolase ArfB [Aquisalimonas sp.]|uniref:alternative ribosome rescue aminoacyl-tRNA hydrolase ArfB n=1 Tax=Aquisalimonas sp. TaxID=1872621 RepID=UPI0025B8A10D|nr:alternative ribosome rescue aminoacyl-tRNA hydrolase ArfB [Aquisalimonas sp.]
MGGSAAPPIEEQAVEERFVRASGPGGQHVNTTETRVQLRYHLGRTTALTERVLHRLRQLAGRRLTGDDVLILEEDSSRHRETNRRMARERLAKLLAEAARPPAPPRRPTRPSRNARKKRMDSKTQRGRRKNLRKPPKPE